ncbi:MAG: cyclic nucleotide-binding domain-containing protein [Bauldia sp.]
MAESSREVLTATPLFADVLDGPLLDALAAKSTIMVFAAGTTLMTEGDFGMAMFVVTEGSVVVTLRDAGGRERQVARLGPGDIVGEMSLLTGARRNATVVATTEVTALEITKVGLEDILRRAPELIDRFGAMLGARQGELDRIAASSRHDAGTVAQQIRRFFPSIFGAG